MLKRLAIKVSSYLGITVEELKAAIIFPLGLLILIIVGDIMWRALGFPPPAETLVLIKGLFMKYGYWLVFISAFIEGLLLVGLYIPGSVALILAATLSGQGVMNIWIVILLITIGFLLSVNVNYLLGRYGWYHVLVKFGLKDAIEKMKSRAETKGIKLIHLTYFNPNLASLSATSFGILHIDYYKFLLHSIIALIYWDMIWGFTFFFFGNWVEDHLNYTSVFIAIALVILIRVIYASIKKKTEVL